MATAHAVADQSVAIAGLLQRGEVIPAMDAIEALADRLEEFLGCVRQAGALCRQRVPQLSGACQAYERRIDTLVGYVDAALAQGNLAGLAETLQHGVAPGARDFAQIETPIRTVLSQARIAA